MLLIVLKAILVSVSFIVTANIVFHVHICEYNPFVLLVGIFLMWSTFPKIRLF